MKDILKLEDGYYEGKSVPWIDVKTVQDIDFERAKLLNSNYYLHGIESEDISDDWPIVSCLNFHLRQTEGSDVTALCITESLLTTVFSGGRSTDPGSIQDRILSQLFVLPK